MIIGENEKGEQQSKQNSKNKEDVTGIVMLCLLLNLIFAL